MGNPRAQRIGELLVKAKVIDPLQLRSALAQHDAWGGRLTQVVVEMGLADEETVVEHLARALGVQRIRLGNVQKDPAALSRLDVAFAEERAIFPVQLRDGGKVLLLAMADPSDLETADEVNRRTRARVTTYIAGESEIRSAISRHYRGQQGQQESPRPTSRPAQKAAAPGAGEEEVEEEFKIVDMSGNTVMKPLAELDPRIAGLQDRPPPPLAETGSPGVAAPRGDSSTADLLDDILGGGGAGHPALSPENLARLQTLRVNQDKSAKIIRAIMELLLEKGALSREDLQQKLRLSPDR